MKYLESYTEHIKEKRPYKKWTDDELAEIAKKYKNHRDFRTNDARAYDVATKKGILSTICSHMKYLQKRWTNAQLEKEARKYKTRRDFRKNSTSAYKLSELRNLLSKFDFLENNIGINTSTTLDELKSEANKYKTIKEFKAGSPNAYEIAVKKDILDEVCVDLLNDIGSLDRWDIKELQSEAKKYKTRTEFAKKSPRMYNYACKKGILDEVCQDMKSLYNTYTMEEIEAAAKKYNSRYQFKKHDRKIYTKAVRDGILDSLCKSLGY